MVNEAGSKFDQGKPRIELIPTEAIDQMAYALMFGARKYDDHNFKKGLRHTRVAGSVLRHIFEWLAGSDKDKESGLHPLAHAAAGLCILLYQIAHKPELDDRYKKEVKSE